MRRATTPVFAPEPDKRNNGVVKISGTDSTVPGADSRTRESLLRLLMQSGPHTAAELAGKLELTTAAVRRHLDGLRAEGQVTARERRPAHPGRGRPAKAFLLTDAGRQRFGHSYDDLAVSALQFLAERDGNDAVRDFVARRTDLLERQIISRTGSASTREDKLTEVAAALSEQGYAASTQHVGSGEQLCQHHCPVVHVAAQFPELCEAETKALSRALGTHVQRLATIARGDAVCTTHVPAARPVPAPTGNPTPPSTSSSSNNWRTSV